MRDLSLQRCCSIPLYVEASAAVFRSGATYLPLGDSGLLGPDLERYSKWRKTGGLCHCV